MARAGAVLVLVLAACGAARVRGGQEGSKSARGLLPVASQSAHGLLPQAANGCGRRVCVKQRVKRGLKHSVLLAQAMCVEAPCALGQLVL